MTWRSSSIHAAALRIHGEPPFAPAHALGTMNPIVLVLVVLLVLENAQTGWDVEEENENDDEDETPVYGEAGTKPTGRSWKR